MSEDRQISHDAIRQEYDRKGLAEVLRAQKFAARPLNRGAEHLMWRDMNDLYHFVCANPEALRQVAA